MKFTDKEKRIISAILQKKMDELTVIMTFKASNLDIEAAIAKYEKAISRGKPVPKYGIEPQWGYVVYHGRILYNNVRPLRNGDSAHDQPWFPCEIASLVHIIDNDKSGDSLEKICKDLEPYFTRHWTALVAKYYRVKNRK